MKILLKKIFDMECLISSIDPINK